MASETALHSNTVSSSRTQADQLVSPQARRALGHFVHAQPYRERGLPVSLWQACNRTRSVIRWPAHCLLALCPYCLTLSLSLSLPLICRSHLIIAPSLSQTLHCTVPTTSPTSPFHCWGGKAAWSHPPSCISLSCNAPTHLLPCSIQNHFTKSTCRQCQIGHISPFLIAWSFCLIKKEILPHLYCYTTLFNISIIFWCLLTLFFHSTLKMWKPKITPPKKDTISTQKSVKIQD